VIAAPTTALADERRATAWACAYHFLLFAAYYTVRPLRDAMGLRGNVKTLPWLFAGTLAAIVIATPLFAALVERLPRRRFVPLVYHFFAANLVAFFFILRGTPSTTAARVFFVWTSVFNLFAVSIFWGFMADRFDRAAAARRFGQIALGGTLGAMAGAAVTTLLAERVGATNLTLVAALLLEAAVLCFFQCAAGSDIKKRDDAPKKPVWHFAVVLARSPRTCSSTRSRRRSPTSSRRASCKPRCTATPRAPRSSRAWISPSTSPASSCRLC